VAGSGVVAEDSAGVSFVVGVVVVPSELLVGSSDPLVVVDAVVVEEGSVGSVLVEDGLVEVSPTDDGVVISAGVLDGSLGSAGTVAVDEALSEADVLSLRANAFTGCIPAPSNNPPIVNAAAIYNLPFVINPIVPFEYHEIRFWEGSNEDPPQMILVNIIDF
jgi:hypothetical protein